MQINLHTIYLFLDMQISFLFNSRFVFLSTVYCDSKEATLNTNKGETIIIALKNQTGIVLNCSRAQ